MVSLDSVMAGRPSKQGMMEQGADHFISWLVFLRVATNGISLQYTFCILLLRMQKRSSIVRAGRDRAPPGPLFLQPLTSTSLKDQITKQKNNIQRNQSDRGPVVCVGEPPLIMWGATYSLATGKIRNIYASVYLWFCLFDLFIRISL